MTQGEAQNELLALVRPLWTGTKVQAALGLTRQEVASLHNEGRILAVRSSDGEAFYPLYQFHRRADGRTAVRPDLVPVIQILREFDNWAVAITLVTPAPELGYNTPVEWARRSGGEQALRAWAAAVAREWSAGSQAPS